MNQLEVIERIIEVINGVVSENNEKFTGHTKVERD